MVFLSDKLGGKIYITGNVHIRGDEVLCEKLCIAQRKPTKEEKFHRY